MGYSPLGRKQHNSPLGRGKGWVLFRVPHFHEDNDCEISMNISRSYRLTHPLYPLPRGEFHRAGAGLQPEPRSLSKRYPVEQSQRPEIHKPPGSSYKLEPAMLCCRTKRLLRSSEAALRSTSTKSCRRPDFIQVVAAYTAAGETSKGKGGVQIANLTPQILRSTGCGYFFR